VVIKKLSIEACVEGDDEKKVNDIHVNLKGFFDAMESGFKVSPAFSEGIKLRVIVKEII
jgi:hypothetical protein